MAVNERPMTMAEALRDAMRIAMQRDPTVFLLGEDIGIEGGFGGGFTVTLGLPSEFGMSASSTPQFPRALSSEPQRVPRWRACDR